MYLDDSINDDAEPGTSSTDAADVRLNNDSSVPLAAEAAAGGPVDEDGTDQEEEDRSVILTKQFRSLGNYPLVTLELRNPRHDQATPPQSSSSLVIPANLLAWTIHHTRNTLQQILADNITLSGNWMELCASLNCHPNLHTMSLSSLKIIAPSTPGHEEQQHLGCVPALIHSLSTCNKLRSLKLCIHHDYRDSREESTSPAVASQAASSTSLIPTQNTTSTTTITTTTILRDLCSLPNLKTLSLALGESTLPSSATSFWMDLCQTLHTNTTLTNLGLPAFYKAQQEEEILQAVGILLRVNSTLHTLSLAYGNPNSLLPIVNALQTQNRSLQHLQLYDHARNYYYKEALKETALVSALVEALHYNFVLESIDLSNHQYHQYQQFQPYRTTSAARNHHHVGRGGLGRRVDHQDVLPEGQEPPRSNSAAANVSSSRSISVSSNNTKDNKFLYSCCSWNSLIEFRLQMNALHRRQLILLGQQEPQQQQGTSTNKKQKHSHSMSIEGQTTSPQQQQQVVEDDTEQKSRNIFYQQILHFQSNLSIVFYLVSQHPNYLSSSVKE